VSGDQETESADAAPSIREPANPQRRRVLQGGLLGAAAALGLLPGCSDGEPSDAAPGIAGSGGAGSAADVDADPVTDSDSAPDSVAESESDAESDADAATDAAINADSAADAPIDVSGKDPTAEPEPAPTEMPRVMLGKTGLMIPIVGLGTSRLGQRGGTPNDVDYAHAVEVFSAAIDRGIEYLDTSAIYGRAEEALGEAIAGRRDRVTLVTKIHTDTYGQAELQFERSLARLGTDHVDILHLHNTGNRNLDVALGSTGAWAYIQEQKAAGRARFVGLTGHNNPANLLRVIETDEADVLMTVMNFVDHSTYGFTGDVLSAAREREMGVMAMKVFGGTEAVLAPGGGFANSSAPEPHPSQLSLSFDDGALPDSMRFVKSLDGVHGMVIGVNHIWEIEQNIQWAIDTQPFEAAELDAVIELGRTLADSWRGRFG
jgi:predicted aldo/keto reductase-like oxidoreductase